jgi:phage repressor protein C with HTH and peptisase S24 domain/DNA-binding XRE family transcriptional regulator
MGLEKINFFKKEQKLTNEDLARLSGVPKSTIDKITSGLTYDPKLETVRAIAKALGKTINDFDDDDEVAARKAKTACDIESHELELINKYRPLSPRAKERIDTAIKKEHEYYLEDTQPPEPQKKLEKIVNFSQKPPITEDDDEEETAEIKFYRTKPAAGSGSDFYMDGEDGRDYDMVPFPVKDIPYRTSYAIRIHGHSMEPTIEDGEVVFVDENEKPADGQIGIFEYDGMAFCKEININSRNGQITLVSHNEDYEDIKITNPDDLSSYGRVIVRRR